MRDVNNRGTKAGRTFGGLGSICWMPILAIVLAVKENWPGAIAGFAATVIGAGYLVVFAPWKHPHVPMRNLFLGFAAMLLAGAAALFLLWPVPEAIRMSDLVFLLPLLLLVYFPFSYGKKT